MNLNISIPDSVVLSTRQSSVQFETEAKIAIAIKFYRDEKLSLGQAAELAGFSEFDFLKLLGQYGISVFRYEGDEESELQNDADLAVRYANG
ncbi:MAG: UPF0175 family protein [Oscillospiraceae bacterium]|nr:UPF0175 family protein [Oscillospiraceae bacterium]